MKSSILIFSVIILLLSCATPRYSYYFDYQHPSSRKQNSTPLGSNPFKSDPDLLMAASERFNPPSVTSPIQVPESKHKSLKESRRAEAVVQSGADVKPAATGEGTMKSMAPAKGGRKDNDLGLSAIFGTAGLLALIIGGTTLNVIGGIAILVGMVLFARWFFRR